MPPLHLRFFEMFPGSSKCSEGHFEVGIKQVFDLPMLMPSSSQGLLYASENLKKDLEIAIAAIQRDKYAINHVAPEIKDRPEILRILAAKRKK